MNIFITLVIGLDKLIEGLDDFNKRSVNKSYYHWSYMYLDFKTWVRSNPFYERCQIKSI